MSKVLPTSDYNTDGHTVHSTINEASATEPQTLSHCFRRRKLISGVLGIFAGFLIVSAIVIVLTIVIEKETDEITTSTIIMSTVEAFEATAETPPLPSPPAILTATTTTTMMTTTSAPLLTTITREAAIHNTWKKNGITVAGEEGKGGALNQLDLPQGIAIDDEHGSIYIADRENHRIVRWRFGAKTGEVVAGGNGAGREDHQLQGPTSAILDGKSDSLVICDYFNSRIMRWSLQNSISGQTLLDRIACIHLAMDNNGDLYISDFQQHVVIRWREGVPLRTVVAGSNQAGDQLSQLNVPSYVFVDKDYSVYVSDEKNNRVMKWEQGAKEGVVVAGGNGAGYDLIHVYHPRGLFVDHLSNVYVVGRQNHRVFRWLKGSREGSEVVGLFASGTRPDQLYYPDGIAFDRQGNLYVVESMGNRVQKFVPDD